MTTLTHPLGRDCINSLGIPVDNLSLQQAIDRIVEMAKIHDGRARLVSTLNVDFLVNSLGCTFSRPRHPELLNVLRTSDMVTADGFPIVWLSKIVGKPLKARVTGADIVPNLARRAVTERLSLFLLGGGEGSAAAAADTLRAANPGLLIAGTAAPIVHTTGPELADFSNADEKLLRQINDSGADILLVGLGNPKQELWFNRNRHKLQVPVAIGVGGTFEFINGTVKRAPQWIQKLNLEWVFRIVQDPGRLWQRYVKGLFTLGMLTAPVVYFRVKEELLYSRIRNTEQPDIAWQSVWSSRDQSLAVLRLPPFVTAGYLEALVADLQKEYSGTAVRLLDFSAVKHIESAGHHEFFRLAEFLRDPKSDISLLGMRRGVKRHLAACRIADFIGDSHSGTTLSALSHAPRKTHLEDTGCKSYVMNTITLIFLSGRVTGEGLSGLGFVECLNHVARQRTCILDLRNVTLLESTAIAELHPLIVAHHNSGEGAILVSGADANVRQMFRMTGLGESVIFIDDRTLVASIAAEGIVHE